MKELLRYGFILGLICVVASGFLAGMNAFTKPKIISQAQAEERSTLQELFPEAEDFKAIKSGEEIKYYKVYSKDNKVIAVAFKAKGKGYSSEIETMVGMLKDGTITDVKILSQNETPGLGSRIADLNFVGQFKDKKIAHLADVQAITGATISSKAVIDSVRQKAEEIKILIENEPR